MSSLRYAFWSVLAIVPSLVLAGEPGEPGEPKLGRYNIRSYGASNRPPLFLGHFVLEEGGKYKAHLPGGRLAGEGTYTFDKAKREVRWLTGIYKEQGWQGRVLVEGDDKSLTILMKPTTRATHAPDAK